MNKNSFNIYNLPDKILNEEEIDVLFNGKNIRIERIVSMGQVSPENFWYDQDEDEWLVLIEGKAILEYETNSVSLSKGDTLFIPAHQRHRINWTSTDPPCIWVCVLIGKGDTPLQSKG